MSETTLLVGNFMGMKVKPGSMGKPGPGYKVDIIDDMGKYLQSRQNEAKKVNDNPALFFA